MLTLIAFRPAASASPRYVLALASHFGAIASDAGGFGAIASNSSAGPPLYQGKAHGGLEAALESINRAIELGANEFEVHFMRAKLANAVGRARSAISYAQQALLIAPADEKNRVKWLREMVTRNTNDLPSIDKDEERGQAARRVIDRRLERLPVIVRWIFADDEVESSAWQK